MLGIAQTGTGKTAAFVLPLLYHLEQQRRHPLPRTTRALILAPTRELAVQISQSISVYGAYSKLRHAVITGGVGHQKQIAQLKGGLDILVATPGRLIDLIDRKELDLGRTAYFVLDEADRMLDIGFIRDVRKIAKLVAKPRQTILFSATMPKSVKSLADEILTDPVTVEAPAKSVAADRVDQKVLFLGTKDKNAQLCRIVKDPAVESVIVFVRTKRRADRVTKVLDQNSIKTSAIHGNKSQNVRQKSLERFKKGRIKALVATDIASRGIDVDGVTHVINFDLPDEAESYVHRIGRTARAGKSGTAISFCDPSETNQLRSIEKLLGKQIAAEQIEASGVHKLPEPRATADADKLSPKKRRRPSRSRQRRRAA